MLPCEEIDPAPALQRVGEVLRVVESAAADGRTLLMVTHERNFACMPSDRVVFVPAGGIHEAGPPAALFGAPLKAGLRPVLSALH